MWMIPITTWRNGFLPFFLFFFETESKRRHKLTKWVPLGMDFSNMKLLQQPPVSKYFPKHFSTHRPQILLHPSCSTVMPLKVYWLCLGTYMALAQEAGLDIPLQEISYFIANFLSSQGLFQQSCMCIFCDWSPGYVQATNSSIFHALSVNENGKLNIIKQTNAVPYHQKGGNYV